MSFPARPLKILLHPASNFAGDLYRMSGPAEALAGAGLATLRTERQYLVREQLDQVRPDVVVVQHQYADDQLVELARYREWLPEMTILYEIDDMLWDLPDTNPHKASLPQDMKRRIRSALKLVDGVVVSTGALRDAITRDFGYAVRNKPIRVIHNTITESFLAAAEEGRRDARAAGRASALPRVGWAGGVSHAADIAFLADLVRETVGEIQWVFLGMAPEGVEHLVEFHDHVALEDYPRALARLDLDLAVAPYSSTPFDDCKSDLRIMEFGAAGFPVLSNREFHGVAQFDKALWLPIIIAALSDRESLSRRANALHRYIADEGSFRNETKRTEWLLAWGPVAKDGARSRFFLPGAAAGNDALVAVSSVEEMQRAGQEHPGASILYRRPGAVVSDESVALLLQSRETSHAASFSGMTNDGDYPRAGQHTELTVQQSRDVEFSLPDGDPIATPWPTGPLVLLSGAALASVGMPDVARYPDVELALIEWGARAARAGGRHIQIPRVWTLARPVERTAEQVLGAMGAVGFWFPEISQAIELFRADNQMADLRRATEQSFFRLAYEAPPTPSYEDWARLHNEAPADWKRRDIATTLAARSGIGAYRDLEDGEAWPPSAATWVILHRDEARLAPGAEEALIHAAEQRPDILLVYGDHDFLNAEGQRVDPWFKGEFNYEHLLGQDYLGPVLLVRRESFERLGLREEFGPAALYDLALRVIAQEVWNGGALLRERVTRVPLVLSSAPVRAPSDPAAERRVVLEHLQSIKASAAVTPHPEAPDERLVRWLPRASASVDIVLHCAAAGPSAGLALSSILARTAYGNFTVYVMSPDGTHKHLRDLPAVQRTSRRVRFIAQESEITEPAEFTCWFDDTLRAVEDSWLHDLVGLADRPGVIAVPRVRSREGVFDALGVLDHDGALIDVLAGARAGETGPHGLGRHTAEWLAVRRPPCAVVRHDDHSWSSGRYVRAWSSVLWRDDAGSPQGVVGTPQSMNPNLQATPRCDLPRALPPRPWAPAEPRDRVLLVNCPDVGQVALACFRDGEVASGAELVGTRLTFNFPPMENVGTLDLRDLEGTATCLARMGITQIDLVGVDAIGLGGLAALARLQGAGLPVQVDQHPAGVLDNSSVQALLDHFRGGR